MPTIKFEFNPFKVLGLELSEDADKADVLERGAEFLKDQVLKYMGQQNSPVGGYGTFKGLTKEYARTKKAGGGSPVPNLEFSGKLKDAIETYTTENKIGIRVKGKQALVADGHCNHSGESKIPQRTFIPADGENWKPAILSGIGRIIKSS